MLWLVTGAAPRTGKYRKEGLTISHLPDRISTA
jgi:hypothetical protein